MIANLEIFADGLDHPECVAVHPDGSVWCGGEAGQIYRIDPAGQTAEEVAHTQGFVLGIAFSPKLSWLAICDSRRKAVLRLDLNSMDVGIFADSISDWRFKIPNFPVFDREGRLYVSESGDFGRNAGRIFRFSREAIGEIWAGGDLAFANGLALDNEGGVLPIVWTENQGS